MFRQVLFAAAAALSLGFVSTPSLAKTPEDVFAEQCAAQGGTMRGTRCTLPDGSYADCQFSSSAAGDSFTCQYGEVGDDEARVVLKHFHRLVKVPVKILKMPVSPGPLAKTMTKAPTKIVKTPGAPAQGMTKAPVKIVKTPDPLASVKKAPALRTFQAPARSAPSSSEATGMRTTPALKAMEAPMTSTPSSGDTGVRTTPGLSTSIPTPQATTFAPKMQALKRAP